MWCLYIIADSNSRKTYVGVTVNLERRLRQHNGEIKGGAKSTRGSNGWNLVCKVEGFRTQQEALQLEWRMHHPLKRRYGIEGRLKTLDECLKMERWTSKSPLCCEIPLVFTKV